MKRGILLFVLVLSLSITGLAQDDTELGKNEFTVWGGISPDSLTFIKGTGTTPDARFGVVAIRYARRFNNNKVMNLKYTVDVVPTAVLSYPDVEISPTSPGGVRNIRPTRYAFGVAPLGLQVNFRPRKKNQPFIGLSGGILYFNKNMPNIGGKRLNFTADLGGGIEIRLKKKRALTFGYKFYHVSNGGRGLHNPGIDNNLFYLGYTFSSK